MRDWGTTEAAGNAGSCSRRGAEDAEKARDRHPPRPLCLYGRGPITSTAETRGTQRSVFRGKQYSLLQDRGEEMIAHRLLLLETARCDRDQGERRSRPDRAHRETEACRGFKLPLRPLGHHAQVHVAVGPRLAAGVRTEQLHRPQRRHAVHGLEAPRQGLALVRQRRRQIVSSNSFTAWSNDKARAGTRQAGSPRRSWTG